MRRHRRLTRSVPLTDAELDKFQAWFVSITQETVIVALDARPMTPESLMSHPGLHRRQAYARAPAFGQVLRQSHHSARAPWSGQRQAPYPARPVCWLAR